MANNPNMLRTLNLGCGKDRTIPGAVSVDINPSVSPDIVHDLNQFPWPFQANTFDAIHCKDILEHLQDLVHVMEEIHRVSKRGAQVHITTPHFSCANSYTDPTHRYHLGFFSFDYFTGQSRCDFYTMARFKKVRQHLFFYLKLKNKLVWRFANRYPAFYEEHLAWMLPAWYLSIELETVK